jgi:hypothetical protein
MVIRSRPKRRLFLPSRTVDESKVGVTVEQFKLESKDIQMEFTSPNIIKSLWFFAGVIIGLLVAL